jgi:hypothetical protein
MYSLPNLPRVRDLSLHWKSRFCGHWAGGGRGAERNGMDSYALPQGRHAIGRGGHRIQKGPISLALGSWRWGGGTGGYSGGEGWGLGVKGRRVAYFLPQTCANIYHTGVFQKNLFCSQSLWDKKANNFKILKFQMKKKTYKGCFLSIMVNKFRIFIKNLRNTYGLHFTNS